MRHGQTLMTEGSIGGQLVSFAVPLFIGNLFQQLYNTADALIVGNLLGSGALAAVSATGNLVFLMISFFGGISAGAGVAISRYFGAGETDKMRSAIHTNIAFSLASAIVLTVLGTTFTPTILRWMGTPADIMEQSCSYIRLYFAGSLSMVLYNALRGIMQAVGDSTHPLIYLIVSSVVNVVLDILFIAKLGTDVGGAAVATVISQFISVFLCMYRLMTTNEDYRLNLREIGFDWPMMKLIVRYGLPSGLQNSVIAIANVVVQSNINVFGTMAVAGCGAYSKIEGFAFLPITSFTIAITTFVGQNLGAKEYERAKKGARFGIICAMILAELIGVAMYIFMPKLAALFSSTPEVIAYATKQARTIALFFCLLAYSHAVASVCRGAGKAFVPMTIMLVVWCVLRITYITIAMRISHDIQLVYFAYPLTWSISSVIYFLYYRFSNWVHGFEQVRHRDALGK